MSASDSTATRNGVIYAGCAVAAMLLLGFVAVMAPADITTRYRFLETLIAVVSTIIPAVERLAAVSSFPGVTRLIVSMTWTLVPIFTAVLLLKAPVPEGFITRFRQRSFYLTFIIVVMAISVVLLAVLYDITPDDLKGGLINETVLRTVSTSRMGLGLIAGFFSAGIAAMVYTIVIWLLNLRRIYFSKRGGDNLCL